jgi:hypothetical protein
MATILIPTAYPIYKPQVSYLPNSNDCGEPSQGFSSPPDTKPRFLNVKFGMTMIFVWPLQLTYLPASYRGIAKTVDWHDGSRLLSRGIAWLSDDERVPVRSPRVCCRLKDEWRLETLTPETEPV